ncbi:PadR family transcriptional regulator [Blautia schinkii]|nr:PadR family transcriptional regulator [Blautia schinkii]
MDTQRKKGVLDICVLSVLQRAPSYGYLIVKEVSECIEISESTLYPILKRLENAGTLTTYKQEHNGRMRKYYQITESGKQKIEEFLSEWEEIKKIYMFVENRNKEEA